MRKNLSDVPEMVVGIMAVVASYVGSSLRPARRVAQADVPGKSALHNADPRGYRQLARPRRHSERECRVSPDGRKSVRVVTSHLVLLREQGALQALGPLTEVVTDVANVLSH
jgi:hypothetical protein